MCSSRKNEQKSICAFAKKQDPRPSRQDPRPLRPLAKKGRAAALSPWGGGNVSANCFGAVGQDALQCWFKAPWGGTAPPQGNTHYCTQTIFYKFFTKNMELFYEPICKQVASQNLLKGPTRQKRQGGTTGSRQSTPPPTHQ
jgi:hypothetical protein